MAAIPRISSLLVAAVLVLAASALPSALAGPPEPLVACWWAQGPDECTYEAIAGRPDRKCRWEPASAENPQARCMPAGWLRTCYEASSASTCTFEVRPVFTGSAVELVEYDCHWEKTDRAGFLCVSQEPLPACSRALRPDDCTSTIECRRPDDCDQGSGRGGGGPRPCPLVCEEVECQWKGGKDGGTCSKKVTGQDKKPSKEPSCADFSGAWSQGDHFACMFADVPDPKTCRCVPVYDSSTPDTFTCYGIAPGSGQLCNPWADGPAAASSSSSGGSSGSAAGSGSSGGASVTVIAVVAVVAVLVVASAFVVTRRLRRSAPVQPQLDAAMAPGLDEVRTVDNPVYDAAAADVE